MSTANELAERESAWGNRQSRAETNEGRGQALRRQAQRCPVKVGGKGSNDDDSNCVQGSSSDVLIQEPVIYDAAVNSAAQHWNWRRAYCARKMSMLPDVQVATPHPKKSVSSVHMGHPRARAAARIGQSSGSRTPRRFRASASKSR